jgi:hypothetical protein
MTETQPPPPPSQRPNGLIAEWLDAVSIRTMLLVVGVLALQFAFVLSYVGAFHHPTPHRVPVQVAAPAALSARAVASLNGLPGAPLQVSAASSSAGALEQLRDGSTDGVLVISARSPRGTIRPTDTLYVAGGGGAAVVTALQDVFTQVEAHQHRALRVVDAVPAQAGDGRGLSGFYLVIGWLIGGYLAAALLSIAHGALPANLPRALLRLLTVALYAIVSGLGGAIIVGPVLGALSGHLLALWGLGTLLVFAAAAVTIAFQTVAGVLGIGLTVILFVVLGNPSAGGAYPPPLLPAFWRAISRWIPNGAGVHAVRRIVYFGAHGITGDLLLIAAYAALGVIVTLALTARGSHAAGAAPAAQPSVTT